MIKLYTAAWCAVCPGIKEKLKEAGVIYQEIDVDTPGGYQEAKDNGVRGLPTLIAINGANEVLMRSGSAITPSAVQE